MNTKTIIAGDEVVESPHWVSQTLKNERKINQNTFIFFKHEWNKRQKQITSHINSYSQTKEKIFARKCKVNKIKINEMRDFCDEYHIQGSNKLSIAAFGIFFKDEMIGVLSLGRHSRDTKITVLDRMCFKDNIRVVGGASKLFSVAKAWALDNGIYSIVSFSDDRYSTGTVYNKMGFKLDCIMPPDYIYIDKNNTNIHFSKQSQNKKSSGCPDEITEKEWALKKGLIQVFDAGKKRWSYKLRLDRQIGLKSRRQGYYETKKAKPRVIYYQSSYELRAATLLDDNPMVESYVNQIAFQIDGRERFIDYLITWSDGSKSILEIKPERRIIEFNQQIDDNKKYAKLKGWGFDLWSEKELGFTTEHYATSWADNFLTDIIQIDLVEERKKRNLTKAKKHYHEKIALDKVNVYCEFCKENHSVLRKSYDSNIKRNRRYICEKEGGRISGCRPKTHLIKENIYAKDGKKQCTNCSEIKYLESFNKDKSRRDGYRGSCKSCESVNQKNKYKKSRSEKPAAN